jgi:hypothetical protein
MMPAAWPDTLPQYLLVDGNRIDTADGRLKSQPDTGPGKMRRRSSAMPRPLSGTIEVSGAQLDILDAFVDAELAGGTLPFTFPKTHGAGTWLVRFAADGLPSEANIGGDRWQVAMGLEILP